MKSKKLKELIAIVLVSTTILAVMPIGANAEWEKDSENNWNWLENGNKATGWKQVDGIWYYFDENGKMKTGWIHTPDSKWYYLNSDGSMKTGWMKDVDGKWYNLASDGAMRTGWMQEANGTWYFADISGAMQTGVIQVEGKTYVLSESGAMLSGNIVIGDKTYTADQSGAIIGDKPPAQQKAFTNEGVVINTNTTSNTGANNNANTGATNNANGGTTSSTGNSSSSSSSSSSGNSSNQPSVPEVEPVITTDAEKLATAKTVIEGLNLAFDTNLETTISKANTAIAAAILPTGVTAVAAEGTGVNAGKVVITIISGEVTDKTIILANGDNFENGAGDNTYETAKPISTDGTLQSHSIYPSGDEDWVKFSAVAGKTYEILTSNLLLNNDTYIELYNTDGTTLIGCNNDDGYEEYASKISFHCSTTGTYYVRMMHYRRPHGESIGTGYYDISITEAELAAELKSIVVGVDEEKTKTEYIVGDPLDISNLFVVGFYDDGKRLFETITSENITGFDSSSPSDNQTLTITINGKTAEYTIYVLAESSAARITSKIGEVNDIMGYISNIPRGTTLEDLKNAITPLGGATFKIYDNNTQMEAEALSSDCYVEVTSADAVNSLIAALPEEGNVILGNQAQIEAARAAFIDLTAAQQGLVTNIAKLTAAEGKLLTLIEAADYEAANAVSSSIAALPEAGSVTLENQAEIEAARAAYNNLTTEQKGFVTNVEKLEAAEAELANL